MELNYDKLFGNAAAYAAAVVVSEHIFFFLPFFPLALGTPAHGLKLVNDERTGNK